MINSRRLRWIVALASGLLAQPALAHDPVFGIGPHVLYQGGVEVAIESAAEKAGPEKEQELALELTYGLTGDWAVGVDLPWVRKADDGNRSSGAGDVALFTKYRFWRRDSLGLQESAAVLLKVVTESADSTTTPPLGKGVTDGIAGLTWGYESRKWYRWASVRYRYNGTNPAGVDRGDMLRVDLVGGIRPTPRGYLEPDTVWLLELNGEIQQKARLNGQDLADTGGMQWFVSPGIFWTLRNFAIKAGVQIPVLSDLNGNQPDADYRARLILEWHL